MEARLMEKMTVRVVLGCLFWALGSVPGQALDSKTDLAIRTATFEFFAPGKASHSKGLVGTAFAIGPNEFVTAAHLLNPLIGSRFGRPVLVDARGFQYRIADILQFSEKQDYITFSVEHPPQMRPLSVQTDQPTSSAVHFAGWTSDGKLLIKDGTFTAVTPDDKSTEFDWIRFKGPVWGGVGGGPLLNDSGRVIGIVQGTARNGGANYAVPIGSLANTGSDKAQLHGTELLRSLMPVVTTIEPLTAEIPLPMSLDDFAHEVQKLHLEYFDRLIGPLLEATRRNFVLRGNGAAELCNLLNGRSCLCKPRTEVSGELVVDGRDRDSRNLLGTSGDVAQVVAGAGLLRTMKNDRRNSDPLKDPASHLKLALTGPNRSDVDLDAATQMKSWMAVTADSDFTDFHGRTWHMRTWPLLDRDLEVVSMVREVGDGYVVVTRTVPTALDYAAGLQLKFIANLVYYQCEEAIGEGVAQVANTVHRRIPGAG
jgi:serine protease Do